MLVFVVGYVGAFRIDCECVDVVNIKSVCFERNGMIW